MSYTVTIQGHEAEDAESKDVLDAVESAFKDLKGIGAMSASVSGTTPAGEAYTASFQAEDADAD